VQGTGKSSNSGGSTTAATGGLTPTTNTSASSGADVPLTAEGQAAAAAANGSTSTSVPSGGSTTVPTSGSTRQGSSQSSNKIIYYRLKLRSGPLGGEMTVKDQVGPSTSLPSKAVPALAFLGVTFDGSLQADQAYFLVSNGVSVITGTGECSFGSPCQLVAMKPGDYMDLTWTDGQQYRVKLLAFERHTRSNPGNSGAINSTPSTQAPSGSPDGSAGSKSGRASAVGKHFSF
jgi:hypothetical protein